MLVHHVHSLHWNYPRDCRYPCGAVCGETMEYGDSFMVAHG